MVSLGDAGGIPQGPGGIDAGTVPALLPHRETREGNRQEEEGERPQVAGNRRHGLI